MIEKQNIIQIKILIGTRTHLKYYIKKNKLTYTKELHLMFVPVVQAKDKDGISKQMETLINRAEVSKIKLIDKNKLRNATNIKDLL